MTEAPPAGTEIPTGSACAACRHDRDAHDRIGARFCSATIAGALSRGCVCVGDALQSVHQAH
jgi:hypothetical protein